MNRVESFWNGLTRVEKFKIVRQGRLWDGLIDFEYRLIPEDLKVILIREMDGKYPFKP